MSTLIVLRRSFRPNRGTVQTRLETPDEIWDGLGNILYKDLHFRVSVGGYVDTIIVDV